MPPPARSARGVAALGADADGFVPYISKPAGAPSSSGRELNNSKRWSTYFLTRTSRPVDDHLAQCPRTARC